MNSRKSILINFIPIFISQRRRDAEINKKITNYDSAFFAFFAPLREILSIIFILSFLVACTPQKLAVRELPIEREGLQVAIVKAEIARTQDERSQGLMFRKKLPDGEGMIFVFEKDEVLSFWMKNTSIPLSIAYIASDGRIIEIKDMYPHDENPVMSSRSARYALEVPQGWFSRTGVHTGDIVKVSVLH
jgi:uncharacterized membrane protein (UPF0127 family)